MTKGQALAVVASHMAGLMTAGTFEENTGVMDCDHISEADEARLSWAIEEVTGRLYRMGSQDRERP